jgi:hypothetical protein
MDWTPDGTVDRWDVKFAAQISDDVALLQALHGIQSAVRWLTFVVFVLGVAALYVAGGR